MSKQTWQIWALDMFRRNGYRVGMSEFEYNLWLRLWERCNGDGRLRFINIQSMALLGRTLADIQGDIYALVDMGLVRILRAPGQWGNWNGATYKRKAYMLELCFTMPIYNEYTGGDIFDPVYEDQEEDEIPFE